MLSALSVTAVAQAGTASTCSAAEKHRRTSVLAAARRRAPAQRRAYFRSHRDARARAAFVAKQRARLNKLAAAARCVIARADLAIALSAPAGPLTWLSSESVVVIVRNAGNIPAEGTLLIEVRGATVVSASGIADCDVGATTICNLPRLEPGASASAAVVVRATRRGQLAVTATVDTLAVVDDVDAGNNAAEAATTVVFPPRLADRPDDRGGPQVHFLYVVPVDGADRHLDESGAIANSVAAFQRWLGEQTGGHALRTDTSAGALDVTFFPLARTDAEVAATGSGVLAAITRELDAAGFFEAGKIYGIYYDGSSTVSCGAASWPPSTPGVSGAIFLHGTPPGSPTCDSNSLAEPGAAPGYFDFAMLHELVHTLGFVAECAPHHGRRGHVVDDPRDLMYAGDEPWRPSFLDIGNDDYYGHSNGACPDLADSPFLG